MREYEITMYTEIENDQEVTHFTASYGTDTYEGDSFEGKIRCNPLTGFSEIYDADRMPESAIMAVLEYHESVYEPETV